MNLSLATCHHATVNTPHGTCNMGHERQIKLRVCHECHRHSVFLFSIQVNDELRLCWQSRYCFFFFFSALPLTSLRPLGQRCLSASVRGLLTEARWTKRGGGWGAEMSRKSKDWMKKWVVWDSPAILHQTCTQTTHTHTQINSHKFKYWVKTMNLAAGFKPRLTWCRPSPRVARSYPAPSCQLSSSVKNLMCGAGPCQLLPLPLLLWWQNWCGVVTGAACKAAGAPHLNELSHQALFIRNSAGLLFLLLTACVFILWMPGFSAHSWFSSTLMFS